MSKTTKRKHVTREVLEEFVLPKEGQQIVKVVAGRGNNLHEVENENGEKFLASMPSKFRKNVWIKRGDFVIVDPISEGLKVKAEISVILYPDQIKYIKEEGHWPEAFSPKREEPEKREETELSDQMEHQLNLQSNDECLDSETDSDNDDDLFVNTNRPVITCYYTDESTSDEEGEDCEGEEQLEESVDGKDSKQD
ncbi:putative RNA-binding protein EIF1AD [Holothuria leucospilota]|uniref:Probable RNA-binding protein EIF1AD n=1 Tax=Holothuria leucospilota TaxID=206669 RepID=A0A9Q1HGB4_HOLLE|nr:putative RNA-binding protein EIF1AD [Holothuria leucospilota]